MEGSQMPKLKELGFRRHWKGLIRQCSGCFFGLTRTSATSHAMVGAFTHATYESSARTRKIKGEERRRGRICRNHTRKNMGVLIPAANKVALLATKREDGRPKEHTFPFRQRAMGLNLRTPEVR
jgi:hypothetical protein